MNSLFSLGMIVRFILAVVIGAGGALGVAAATATPASSAVPGPDSSFQLTSDTGDQPAAVFGITAIPDQEPVKLTALPDDQTLQLVAYAESGSVPSTSVPGFRPAWLAATGFPRVVPITQFDGGPLQNSNCTMAAGAMLARLGFGIVATGSQLRALQPDQEGGTSLADLEVAIERYGVSFSRAPISALQLRALLYAGAGAVIQGIYGVVPVDLRLQKDFTSGHAIYLDGFRPASADGPAAFYVIDPLGPGYRGGWWPADVVEAFGPRSAAAPSTPRGTSRSAGRQPATRCCRPTHTPRQPRWAPPRASSRARRRRHRHRLPPRRPRPARRCSRPPTRAPRSRRAARTRRCCRPIGGISAGSRCSRPT